MPRPPSLAFACVVLASCASDRPAAPDGEHVERTVRETLARAHLRERRASSRAGELPLRATSPIRLRAAGGASVALTLLGVRDVPGYDVLGVRVHPGAVDGGHLVRAAIPGGIEEFVLLERGEPGALRFRLALDSAAGLRLVGRVLEVLDGEGVPRLRMEAPYAVDAAGGRAPLDVAIAGCDVSTDPAPPWGKPVRPTGAGECELVVSWRAPLAAPAVIDPAWTTTGSMAVGRALHDAAKVAGGRVLVAGGTDTSMIDPLASAELYDPATGTWATTGALGVPRLWHTLTALADGRALASGGSTTGAAMNGSGVVDAAEVYDPATGTWSSPTHMSDPRRFHTATLLDDGRVLVAGGIDSLKNHVGSAEVFAPTSGTWTKVPGGLVVPRSVHSATKRKDGSVLLVGGETGMGTFDGVSASELFAPAKNAFSVAPSLLVARKRHVAALTDDGSVVVLAGTDGMGEFLLGAEQIDPTLGGFTAIPGAIQARVETAATIVFGGDVLVVGGYGPAVAGTTTGPNDWLATSEVFRPSTATFVKGADLASARSNHTVTLLDDGRVLAAGGDKGPLASAEIYGGIALGGSCTGASDCTSGFCVDGVCCDKACSGQCEACDGAKKGICAPVSGIPHGARAVCAGAGKCAGACDGKSGASCAFPDVKAPCLSSCDPAKGEAAVAYCDGIGACGGVKPTACSPYACGADACLAACAGEHDCATGFLCQSGKCVPPGSMCVDEHTTQANGKTVDCSPFKCGSEGTCKQTCASSADCASGFACGANGFCTKPPPAAPADGGSSGGCALGGRAGERSWELAALAALGALRRRRRAVSP